MALKKFLFLLAAVSLLLLLRPLPTHAQDPDPEYQALADLVGLGMDVIDVGYYPDAQGNPDKNIAFVQMQAITADMTDEYVFRQVLLGFRTLAKYFPASPNLLVVLKYDRWLLFFITTAQDWDDVAAKRVPAQELWQKTLAQIRIYDTVEKKYLTAKDFTSQNQTNKNQTNKDFSGKADSPLPPINQNPNAQAENILLEPSTTFLPADGTTQGFLLATLTDKDFAGLPGRGVNFTYEVRGQDEKALGAAQTDGFGTARSKITSSRALDAVLLRASTASLNATTQILVGPAPGTNADARKQAVIDGLASQGYRDVDAAFTEFTAPTGRAYRVGIAAVRVTSDSFDRTVYSQLSRMMGTLQAVVNDLTYLRPILLYVAADGHDYALLFTMRADIWNAYVRGELGENQLWASLSYDGAVNENGVRTDDKDFLAKNFTGAKQTRYSNAPRQVVSTLTAEEWGEQLTVGSFLVPLGGYADTFRVTELSGSANGFTLYRTPEYKTPLYEYTRGADAALSNLRLSAGQYIVNVQGSAPPAKVGIEFVEHLGR